MCPKFGEYYSDPLCSDPDTNPDDWDAGELPDWKDDLLDPVWTGSPQGILTKYYYEASLGKLFVLGDYLVDSIGGQKPIVLQSTSLNTTTVNGQIVRSLS